MCINEGDLDIHCNLVSEISTLKFLEIKKGGGCMYPTKKKMVRNEGEPIRLGGRCRM